jgi:hypothetical protein
MPVATIFADHYKITNTEHINLLIAQLIAKAPDPSETAMYAK